LREFYEGYWFFCEARQGFRELTFFLDQLHPGDVLYDIRAFHGAYSVAAKAEFGESLEAHLFEPVQTNLEGIRAVADLNNLGKFEVVAKAVGSGVTIKGMLNTEFAMLRQGESSGALVGVEFPSTTVDTYVAEVGAIPTVMKVDVDGFELEVLAGARHCLSEYHPRLWLELHPSYLAAQGRHWEELPEVLKSLGYHSVTFFEDFRGPAREISFHVWCEK
jgi:FkbM family methyltransferase